MLFILGGLSACIRQPAAYEEYHKFINLSWNRFEILTFEVPVDDIQIDYDIYLNVRHIPEIPYKEMLVNFTIFSPGGDMRTADYTLEFFDPEGKKLSDCLGDYCDLLVPIRKAYRFYEPGTARIEIENKYSKLEMPGIIEIGLILKKAEEESQ